MVPFAQNVNTNTYIRLSHIQCDQIGRYFFKVIGVQSSIGKYCSIKKGKIRSKGIEKIKVSFKKAKRDFMNNDQT